MEKIYTLNQVDDIVQWILEQSSGKRVWLLNGNVGAGKTTLIVALMQYLKSKDEVSSPTFSLINEYELPKDAEVPYQKVYHADLYRLRDVDEAIDAGVESIINDTEALCIIEWPEIAQPILPKNTLTLDILHWENDTRKIILN